MIHSSWVALQGMVHSFIELHMPLCHDKAEIYEGVSEFSFLKYLEERLLSRNLDFESW